MLGLELTRAVRDGGPPRSPAVSPSTTSPSTIDPSPRIRAVRSTGARRSASRTIRRRTSERVGGSSRSSPATSVTSPGHQQQQPAHGHQEAVGQLQTCATRWSRAASVIARTARSPSRRPSGGGATCEAAASRALDLDVSAQCRTIPDAL